MEFLTIIIWTKIVSEYDQEIPQSQTADNPVAPRGRAAQSITNLGLLGCHLQFNANF